MCSTLQYNHDRFFLIIPNLLKQHSNWNMKNNTKWKWKWISCSVLFYLFCVFLAKGKIRIFTFHVEEKFKFLLLLLHYNVVCSQCQKPSSISNKIKPKKKNYTQFSLFFPYCSSVMREWGMNGGSWRKFVFLQYDVAYYNISVAYYNKKEGIAHSVLSFNVYVGWRLGFVAVMLFTFFLSLSFPIH